MDSPILIGAALREARMAQGRDIRECAGQIHIRARYLAAIEDGRFEDLPGEAYVGGFVRAYAGHLGVSLEGFAEPERDLPVQGQPERRSGPVYLTVTRTRAGRRLGWLAWAVTLVVAAALIALLALWLGVLDGGPVVPSA